MSESISLADRELATAAALYPTMTPSAAPVPPSPDATTRANSLYPSMPPAQSAEIFAEQVRSPNDTPPVPSIPEAHWARVEDFERWRPK